MKNAFKLLEDCHIESKKLLEKLKKKFSRSIDKKSRTIKDEN